MLQNRMCSSVIVRPINCLPLTTLKQRHRGKAGHRTEATLRLRPSTILRISLNKGISIDGR
jgi:hypothetical protein